MINTGLAGEIKITYDDKVYELIDLFSSLLNEDNIRNGMDAGGVCMAIAKLIELRE